jgi:hypothetical protein
LRGLVGNVEAGFAFAVPDNGLEVDAAAEGFGAEGTRGAAAALGGGADLVDAMGFFTSGLA